MPLNVILTVHLDALGLASSGAVTVRNLDGECVAIETFHLAGDSSLPEAAVQLSDRAREILLSLPEQLAMFT